MSDDKDSPVVEETTFAATETEAEAAFHEGFDFGYDEGWSAAKDLTIKAIRALMAKVMTPPESPHDVATVAALEYLVNGIEEDDLLLEQRESLAEPDSYGANLCAGEGSWREGLTRDAA